jgi:hypothetical protein
MMSRMDQAAILRDYMALRKVSVALNTRLAEMLSGDAIGVAAAALGTLHGKHIDLETEDEFGVVMDYAIHNVLLDGRNAVDRLLEEDPPPEGSPELRLLRSMQKSHFTIFEVKAPIPGFGVGGLDGPKRTPIVIVDLGFSATAVADMALATRIHSPGEGWWMTTGAALPLNEKALDRIVREFNRHNRRFAAEPSEQEMTTMIIRSCIACGASRQIRYAGFGESKVPPTVARVTRDLSKPERNDPCPCGSGKKYKRCCGS